MRCLLFGIALCASTASFAADGVSTNGVRNPFWPMGYEGVRETISPNVRKKPKKAEPKKAPPAMTVAERKKQEAEKAAAEKAAKEARAREIARGRKRELERGH